MKRFMWALLALIAMGLCNCATDLVVSTATTAEAKKEEAEQAAETKNQILQQAEENQKKAEERKDAYEDQ